MSPEGGIGRLQFVDSLDYFLYGFRGVDGLLHGLNLINF
ncbi:hypothetical protein C943_00851 [Mariniradius saccharolyticus AK6]|uniref:Uncharacterized protein n=1 Tax=Mariniradius saccharolyticus AK6 TaxID=1239962 RepID=M7X5Y0_9BACT|nr:hypothetical protein C943_00851 [Mariniradius saccharolyticus AK6]